MTLWNQESFGQRAQRAAMNVGPLCVGIDPHVELLQAWGLNDTPAGLAEFALRTLDAVEGTAGFIKPQSAFFERHGSQGIAVLEDIAMQAQERDIITIFDVKRGDIGSTMAGYAQAYLGDKAPLAADAITVSPYLGPGSLDPAVDLAHQTNRGLFALCLTSNPEGHTVQHATNADGVAVARMVVDWAGAHNSDDDEWGSIGLVVGATTGSAAQQLGCDFEAAKAPLLVPGIGAQGATADDVSEIFGPAKKRVIASASRSILRQGPDTAAMRHAIMTQADELKAALY